jgi:para-nitrobenzyl esterase
MKQLLTTLALCCGVLPAAGWADAVTATIDTGTITGVGNGQTSAFKGIPYATPPVGISRWRPPTPAQPWTGARQAVDFGASCPQAGTPPFTPRTSQAATTSEDCLYLNVWAPAKALDAPVVVWIHGGGNTAGNAAQIFYDGSAFARDGIVLVSFNYRLGLFGFFAHPDLQSAAANFALLDQIAALAWVKRNIHAFGGDPGRVTVMGESAGGQDILALMTAPAARGLFTRAILESPGGGWQRYPTLEQAKAQGVTVGQKLGATTAEALRKVSADALVQAAATQDVGPIVDGTLIAETPIRAVLAGHVPAIPILIGSNSGEGSLLPPAFTLADGPVRFSDADIAALRKIYGPLDDHDLARAVFRDGAFAGVTRFVAGHWSAPAYLYRFEYVPVLMRARRADSWHGSEIPFVFDTADFARADEDRKVVSLLHDCWVAFIRNGAPQCAGAPAWPAYRSSDDQLMRLSAAPAMTANPAAAPLSVMAGKLTADAR